MIMILFGVVVVLSLIAISTIVKSEVTTLEIEYIITRKNNYMMNKIVATILVLAVLITTVFIDYKMIEINEYDEITIDSIENVIMISIMGIGAMLYVVVMCKDNETREINEKIRLRRIRVGKEITDSIREYEREKNDAKG